LLRLLHDLVHGPLLVGRIFDVHRASRVRRVAVLDPAEVEDDHVALQQHALSELVVRVGAVRPGADERELDSGVPVGLQCVRKVGRHIGLLAAGKRTPTMS
jgi:hypothetical protein